MCAALRSGRRCPFLFLSGRLLTARPLTDGAFKSLQKMIDFFRALSRAENDYGRKLASVTNVALKVGHRVRGARFLTGAPGQRTGLPCLTTAAP